MYPYHAIETNGRYFCIKQVMSKGLINPVDGRAYKTLSEAQQAATEQGFHIEKIGSTWEII